MTNPENIEEIKKFASDLGFNPNHFLGEIYNGNLDLSVCIYLPDNVVIIVNGDIFANNLIFLPSKSMFKARDIYFGDIQEIDDVVTIICNELHLESCPIESIFHEASINCNKVHYLPTANNDNLDLTWALFLSQHGDKSIVDFVPNVKSVVPDGLTFDGIFSNPEYIPGTGIAYINKNGMVVFNVVGYYLRVFLIDSSKNEKNCYNVDIREHISLVDKV